MPSTSKRDYYEVLAVTRESTSDQIKSAYRKAALLWHPDRNPENKADAEHKFREASEAYSVLSDPQKRAAYDRYGHAGVSGQVFDASNFGTIFEEFQDIFGDVFGFQDIFGGGGGRSRTRRPASKRKSRFRAWRIANRATARAPSRERKWRLARRVADAARCIISRDFSPSRGRAQRATARDK